LFVDGEESMNFRNLVRISFVGAALFILVGFGGLSAAINLSTTSGTWDNATGNPTNYSGNGTSTIQWGNAAGWGQNSGYNFTGLAPQNNLQLDTPFAIGTFIHYNYPITGNAITGADLNVVASLNINGTLVNFNGTYQFSHNETPNVGGDNCCNDIVSFVNNFEQLGTFQVDGQDYTIALLGFKTSADGPLLSEFSTIEGKKNKATLFATITKAVPVPEPSTYLMMTAFLGVCGVLAVRRKRASTQC